MGVLAEIAPLGHGTPQEIPFGAAGATPPSQRSVTGEGRSAPIAKGKVLPQRSSATSGQTIEKGRVPLKERIVILRWRTRAIEFRIRPGRPSRATSPSHGRRDR